MISVVLYLKTFKYVSLKLIIDWVINCIVLYISKLVAPHTRFTFKHFYQNIFNLCKKPNMIIKYNSMFLSNEWRQLFLCKLPWHLCNSYWYSFAYTWHIRWILKAAHSQHIGSQGRLQWMALQHVSMCHQNHSIFVININVKNWPSLNFVVCTVLLWTRLQMPHFIIL